MVLPNLADDWPAAGQQQKRYYWSMRLGYRVVASLALPMVGVVGCALVVSYSDYQRSEHGAAPDAASDTATFGGGAGWSNGGGSGGVGRVDATVCGVSSICVQEAPVGWNGPLALHQGPARSPPACSGGYGVLISDLNDELDCGVASCSCGPCAPPTNVACSPDILTAWGNSTCTSFLGSSTLAGCAALPAGTVAVGSLAPKSTGTCGTAALGADIPAPIWLNRVRLCGRDPVFSGSCANGSVCAPSPEAPFLPALCVVAPGDVACPSGEYSTRSVFYSAVVDDRGCTACTCSGPASVNCNAVIDLFNDNGCSGSPVASVGSPGCKPLAVPVSHFSWKFLPSGAVCGPAASQLSGSCAPSGATTVCCRA